MSLIEKQAEIATITISVAGFIKQVGTMPIVQSKMKWIPCSERLPEEDCWVGGSSKQFSNEVLVTVVNHDDDDSWVYISHTVDGEWMLELPRHCKIIAWMPLPEPWKGERDGQ